MRAKKRTVAALKLNNSLKKLNLGNNKITAKDAIQIANLLKANSLLEHLDLSNNNLEDGGLETVIEALSMQPKERGLGHLNPRQ